MFSPHVSGPTVDPTFDRAPRITLSRRGATGAIASFLAGGLAACSRAGSAGGAPIVNLASIAYPSEGKQIFNGLTGIIQRDGWLKGELAKRGAGLAFTPIPTAVGAPLINEGFSGKRIDFASYGDFPAIIAVAGGVPLKLVAPLGQGQDVYLLVGKGSTAGSIHDLKGKRIALHRGRPWELPFAKLLDANSLSFDDFSIVNINPSATPAALASGAVDATVLLSDAVLLEQKGVGRIIWSTRQAPADWKMRAELFARGGFIDDHPDLAQLVVNAYVRAAYWSAQDANREQVTRDAARGLTPEDIVRKEYAAATYPWKERFSPLFRPEVRSHYRSVAEYAAARGLVRGKVDSDSLLDDRFVRQALKDQHLDGFWASGEPA